MEVIFYRGHTRRIHDHIDNVRAHLKSVLKTRWHDLSHNITGDIAQNDAFYAKPKLHFPITGIFGSQSFTVITGKLVQEGDVTMIHYSVKPSASILLILAVIIIGCSYKAIDPKPGEEDYVVAIIGLGLFFLALIGGIAIFSGHRLKKRFERLLLHF